MPQEIRSGLPVEIRESDNVITVSGYAAVFNQEATIGDYFIERIAPGAFSSAITRDDVVFLINHEGLPMARTRSRTLKLTEDERGLFMESELDPDDTDVKLIIPKMRRGDLDKMSFRFTPMKQEWDDTGELPVRTLLEVGLSDVSIVTFPAYEGTDIALRSLQDHRSATQPIPQIGHSKARMRMNLSLIEAQAK